MKRIVAEFIDKKLAVVSAKRREGELSMEKLKFFKVGLILPNHHDDTITRHVVAKSREDAIERNNAIGTILYCKEFDVEFDMRKLMTILYEGGFTDSQVGIITDLVNEFAPSAIWN